MIQLHRDWLVVENAAGQAVPCSVEGVMVELMNAAEVPIDAEIVEQAASAVLHYFKCDLGREFVSVGEFSLVLKRVLRQLGIPIRTITAASPDTRRVEVNLLELAVRAGEGTELSFFCALRKELDQHRQSMPDILILHQLRSSVRRILGAKRWSPRCQFLNDQIVTYVRSCLTHENLARSGCVVLR